MKFIKLNNLSLNSISKQETQQKIENTSDANKSEEKETQKSPNNPTFWQNTLFKKKQYNEEFRQKLLHRTLRYGVK